MKLTDAPHGIRFGLYVFTFLIIFCLAQLTWWIVYQLDLNRQLNQHRKELLTLKIESITDRINSDFRRSADLAGYALQASTIDWAELENYMNNLLSDQTIIAYQMAGDMDNKAVIGGSVDSTFYCRLGAALTLYFDPDYPRRMINSSFHEIVYNAKGYNNGEQNDWIRSEMFSISPAVLEQIESESQKGLKMFIFEGSFFMIVVLFGAYLIYRTLQKSEDLKARQVNFIQSVTHEFRTPLTSVRLYLETLQSGRIEPQHAQELCGKMIEDCDRLDRMVDNVLEAGQWGREKYELALSVSDLAGDLNAYTDELKPYIHRQNGSIETDFQKEIRIRSDYGAMRRAIRALIDNALKYSPPDRRAISVSLTQEGKNAVITISDQGIGIPDREQSKIFDRFYRVDGTDLPSVKGSGLGLYLVRHIIKAHGGIIEVDSKEGDPGTRFIIRLPVAES